MATPSNGSAPGARASRGPTRCESKRACRRSGASRHPAGSRAHSAADDPEQLRVLSQRDAEISCRHIEGVERMRLRAELREPRVERRQTQPFGDRLLCLAALELGRELGERRFGARLRGQLLRERASARSTGRAVKARLGQRRRAEAADEIVQPYAAVGLSLGCGGRSGRARVRIIAAGLLCRRRRKLPPLQMHRAALAWVVVHCSMYLLGRHTMDGAARQPVSVLA